MAADPTTDTVTALRGVDLFAGLSDKALRKLAAKTRAVEHEAGKDVVAEGREGTGFHLVRAGSAEVVVHGRVARTLGPGDYFGEISLIDGRPRSATVRATGPLSTLSLVSWDFAPLLQEAPEITHALLLAMCARLRDAEGR